MFSVITNIYDRKTKGPTLMGLFTATRKLKKFFFWQLDMLDVCAAGDTAHSEHGTRPTSSSAVNGRALDFCLHRHPVSVNCLYHARMVLSVGRVLCVLCTKCTLHSNHRLTVWYSNTRNDFCSGATIFSLHTLASPSGRNVNYDEKQLPGKIKSSVVPSICTGFVNTCPTVFL
jgi:hypothetical protein